MKVAVGMLLVLVALLTWRLAEEVGVSQGLRSEIQGLTAKLADSSKRVSLELQAKCASQAEKVFRVMGYKENQQNGNIDIYQSHYNAAFNKCFLTIETTNVNTTPGTMFINKFLLDAYEQR